MLLLTRKDEFSSLNTSAGEFYKRYKKEIDKEISRVEKDFNFTHDDLVEYIEKMVPNISSDVIEKQKSLQSGTCVAFGKMMKIPLIVKMQLPNPEPQSTNAKIFDKWMIQWKSN